MSPQPEKVFKFIKIVPSQWRSMKTKSACNIEDQEDHSGLFMFLSRTSENSKLSELFGYYSDQLKIIKLLKCKSAFLGIENDVQLFF